MFGLSKETSGELLKFPVKGVFGNLEFTYSGKVWAWFEVSGFSYDLEDYQNKMNIFAKQLDYLKNQTSDLHFIVLPENTDASTIIDRHIRRMEYKNENQRFDLFKYGVDLMSRFKQTFAEQRSKRESRSYKLILGVQLNKSKNVYRKGNIGNQSIRNLRAMWRGLNESVDYGLGNDELTILDETIQMYKNQSESVENTLKKVFETDKAGEASTGERVPARALTEQETLYHIESHYSATTNNRDIEGLYEDEFYSEMFTEHGESEVKGYRIKPDSYLKLHNSYVQEMREDILRLSKRFKSEHQEVFVRNVAVSQFHDYSEFPGKEWIYRIQKKLKFPVTISIRAHIKDNLKTVKDLSNASLELEDQENEAIKAGKSADQRVQKNKGKLMNMNELMQSTNMPSYHISVVFKVVASSVEQLDLRTAELEEALRTFKMTGVAPYGEQQSLFMEALMGGEQYFKDYKHQVEPAFLASAMFGATNTLGDNDGFPIGRTSDGKIVYIYPEQSAKGFDGANNKSISLATMVAGATGFGKSVFMNLYIYLAVMTGSYGFVLDPKGDRKGWKNGLPLLPKKFIRVWTLGANKKDAGSLDPFNVYDDIDDAIESAENIFGYLLKAEYTKHKYNFLSQGLNYAGQSEQPCMAHAIDYLKQKREESDKNKDLLTPEQRNELIELHEAFITLQRRKFTSLLIGEPGKMIDSLDFNKPLQVVMIENMTLPKRNKDPKEYTQDEKIATAIMLSLSGFIKRFMNTEYENEGIKRHKVALFDETSALEANPSGAEILDHIVRMGRYYNITLLKGSQNATDHGEDSPNMGAKFSFCLKDVSEAKKMLQTLNLEQSQDNINKIMNLKQGECIYQDAQNRTDKLKVDCVYKEIFEAFQTDTSSEDEREFEKNLRKRG
ncbi:ATP-binding protein [Staphylococcus aureus]|nr:ATP-binding protein [Staphylococcus aureus]